MSSYYYLLAALPCLSYDGQAPLLLDEFLGFVQTQVDEHTLKIIKSSSLLNLDLRQRAHPFFRRYQLWEISLRHSLALLRAQALKREAEPYLRGLTLQTAAFSLARQAWQAADPLTAELILGRGRFQFLSDLEVGYQFSLVNLISYRLKLEILVRKDHFKEGLGQAKLIRLGQELFEGLFGS